MLKLKPSFLFFLSGFLVCVVYNGCAENGFVANTPFSSSAGSSGSVEDDGLEPGTPPELNQPEAPGLPGSGNPPQTSNPTSPSPSPAPNSAPNAIMVTGHWGSSLYSCDGGLTWEGYQSLDPNFRCWDPAFGNVDCDHAASSNFGLAAGPLGFVASYGWGRPGQVAATRNGRDWSVVQSGSTWAGVAFGAGTYILNERRPLVSTDLITWNNGGALNFTPWNARRIFFVQQGEGLFISTAQSGDVQDLMISRDRGQSWQRPTNLPASCGNGSVANSAQTILLLSSSLCRSTDQGQSWQVMEYRPPGGEILFDGQEFKVYDRGRVYRSVDGRGWAPENLQVGGVNQSDLSFSLVAYQPSLRRYAAIAQGWNRWYENTQYYHSDNGINWSRVDKAMGRAPLAPHPVRQIAVGRLEICR